MSSLNLNLLYFRKKITKIYRIKNIEILIYYFCGHNKVDIPRIRS